jgi:hypothetical protein
MKRKLLLISTVTSLAILLIVGSVSADDFTGGCFVTGTVHIGGDENGNGIADRPGAGTAPQDSQPKG